MAIFRKAGSKKWHISYNIGGKQYRQTLRTESLKQARMLAKTKDAELTLGTAETPTKSSPLLTDVIQQYAESVAARGRAKGTQGKYRTQLDQFSEFAKSNGILRLSHINAGLLERFQEAVKIGPVAKSTEMKRGGQRKNNGQRTARDKLKTIRQLIRWALKRQILNADPTAGYELPAKVKSEAFCWTPEEHRHLRSHCEQPWLDVFDFLATTGLRHEEFCWLLRDDVVFGERSFLYIREKRCPQTGIAWQPKFGRERVVPLCAQAVPIVQRALESSEGPWLFWAPHTRGTQVGHFRPSRILKALNRAKAKAGIKSGCVHTFRHMFCSFMANHGVPPAQLMRILGHESLDVTIGYYHLDQTELLKTLDGVPFDQMLVKEPEK